jgi:6-phosphogluconolactonase
VVALTGTTPGRALEPIVASDPFAAAAGFVASALERVAAERGRVRLAVPGGSAAATVAQAAGLLEERGFDFARVLLTWVDERCVPASSPDSNRGGLQLGSEPGVVLPLFTDGERAEDAVARVERELAATFEGALDVVVLGMGADGHVASLFPGRAPPAGRVAHVRDSPKPPTERITLTRAMLATARHTFVVAAGEEKRAALERLVAGDATLPASGLPGLVVCTDMELGEPQ